MANEFDSFLSDYNISENEDTSTQDIDAVDAFIQNYNYEQPDVGYPEKEQMIDVPQEPTEETPSITTQYMMGLLSKTNDEDTHLANAYRVFRKNNYDIVDYTKNEGVFGMPDQYKFKLKKWKDADGNVLSDEQAGEYWLDEGSFTQAVWDEVGDIGEYTGAVAGGVIGKTPTSVAIGKQLGNGFDQWLSHMVTGEELSATGRAKEAGKVLALSTGEILGYKAAKKVADVISPSYFSTEAKTLMDRLNIPERDAMSILEGVPKKDQAKVLAQQSGSKGAGYMAKAVSEDDATRLKYLDELTARKKAVEETAGKADFNAIKRDTENEYGAMKKYAESVEPIGEEGYDLKGYIGLLDSMSDVARTDVSKTRIKAVSKQLEDNPINSLSDMIDLRQVINYEMKKVSGTPQAGQWKELKDNLDAYMKKVVSPEDMKIVDDSIASYARMKNQEEVLELIEKSSSGLGKGAKVGETGAVDWNKLGKLLKDSKLDSPEVRNVVKITKDFTEKYGDMDAKLFSSSLPKGLAQEAQTLAESPHGAAQRLGVRKLVNFFLRQVTPDLRVQHAISQSIKKSDSQAEFVLNVIKNENTPKSIKDRFKNIAEKNNLTRGTVNRNKFISRKAVQETKTLQDKVQKTSIAMDKKDLAIESVDNVISKLSKKLNKRKTNAGKATVQRQIDTYRKKRTILMKEREMIARDHADIKKQYESATQRVEELSMFSPKSTSGTKPVKETYPTDFVKQKD